MGKPRKNTKDAKLDLRFTPSYGVAPIIDTLQLKEDWFIWEPACGNGDLLTAMLEHSPAHFWGTELTDGQDFFDDSIIPEQLKEDPDSICSGIITNPPYSIKPQWLKRCFEVTHNVALLLPVESIASSKLRTIWNENNGVSMILTDTRIDFRGKDQKWFESCSNFSSAWFVSGFDIEPNQILHSSIKDEKKDFKQMCRFLNI